MDCRSSLEIGSQHFDRGAGPGAHRQNAAIKVLRAAIGKIVASHRSDDDMLEAQPMRRFGHALGLVKLQRLGRPARDRAKAAWARADVAHDHERGRAPRVAFGPIGAAAVFADRLEVEFAQQVVREEVFVALGQWPLQPFGQAPGARQRSLILKNGQRHHRHDLYHVVATCGGAERSECPLSAGCPVKSETRPKPRPVWN